MIAVFARHYARSCRMSSLSDAAVEALRLIAGADPKLMDIVLLSLRVSLSAVAVNRFPAGAR